MRQPLSAIGVFLGVIGTLIALLNLTVFAPVPPPPPPPPPPAPIIDLVPDSIEEPLADAAESVKDFARGLRDRGDEEQAVEGDGADEADEPGKVSRFVGAIKDRFSKEEAPDDAEVAGDTAPAPTTTSAEPDVAEREQAEAVAPASWPPAGIRRALTGVPIGFGLISLVIGIWYFESGTPTRLTFLSGLTGALAIVIQLCAMSGVIASVVGSAVMVYWLWRAARAEALTPGEGVVGAGAGAAEAGAAGAAGTAGTAEAGMAAAEAGTAAVEAGAAGAAEAGMAAAEAGTAAVEASVAGVDAAVKAGVGCLLAPFAWLFS